MNWTGFGKAVKQNIKSKLNGAASFAVEVAQEFDFIAKSASDLPLNCSCHVRDEDFWQDSMIFAKTQTELEDGKISTENITIEVVKKLSNYMQYFLARIYNRIRLYLQNLPKILDKTTSHGVKRLFQSEDMVSDLEATGILTSAQNRQDCPHEHILGVIYQDFLRPNTSDNVKEQLTKAERALKEAKEVGGITFDNPITLLYHFEKHGVPEFHHKRVDQYMERVRKTWMWSGEASDRRKCVHGGKVSVTQEVFMTVQELPGSDLVNVQTCFIKRE